MEAPWICEVNVTVLCTPGNLKFAVPNTAGKYTLSLKQSEVPRGTDKFAEGSSAADFIIAERSSSMPNLLVLNSSNKGNDQTSLKVWWKYSSEVVGAPSDETCWKRALCCYVWKPNCGFCGACSEIILNYIRLTYSQDPPWLIGTILWLCSKSIAGPFKHVPWWKPWRWHAWNAHEGLCPCLPYVLSFHLSLGNLWRSNLTNKAKQELIECLVGTLNTAPVYFILSTTPSQK